MLWVRKSQQFVSQTYPSRAPNLTRSWGPIQILRLSRPGDRQVDRQKCVLYLLVSNKKPWYLHQSWNIQYGDHPILTKKPSWNIPSVERNKENTLKDLRPFGWLAVYPQENSQLEGRDKAGSSLTPVQGHFGEAGNSTCAASCFAKGGTAGLLVLETFLEKKMMISIVFEVYKISLS